MHVSEEGRVSGSIDRAKLAELYSAADDELRVHYEEVDPGIKDYVDSLEAPVEEPVEEAAPVEEAETEPEDLSGLTKAQLVERYGPGGDQMTKAQLVEALGG